MESKKQTALEHYERVVSDIFQEFVRDEITKTELIVKIHNAFYPALKLEKEQIQDAFYFGIEVDESKVHSPYKAAENYFKQTYE
jgi:hypothetical protein